MPIFDHPDRLCPACGRTLAQSSNLHGENRPQKGQYSVCIYCAAVLVYDTPTTFHLMTTKEELTLGDKEREQLSELQAAVKSLRRQGG